jgi:hypothetical protein
MQLQKKEFIQLDINRPKTSFRKNDSVKKEEIRKEDLKDKIPLIDPIRSAKKRMKDALNMPEIDQLLSMIWQSQELHILFADTGAGKSIFAMGLALSICKGVRFLGLNNETNPQGVLFYDFELSDRQFRKRYTDEYGNEDPLDENLYIDTINFAQLIDLSGGYNESFIDILFEKIRHDIQSCQATVLIIDNLTFLNTQSTQDTQIALNTMRRLNELKNELNLSILVLAHTPKKAINTPITINDLAGSKHLSNFADSISAIGKSSIDTNIRYLKQIKPSRSGEMLYDADNIIVMEIVKNGPRLTYDFIEFGLEKDHLKDSSNSDYVPDKLNEASNMLKEGKSYSQIANYLGISKGTLSKWKNKYPAYFNNGNLPDDTSVSFSGNLEYVETQETPF